MNVYRANVGQTLRAGEELMKPMTQNVGNWCCIPQFTLTNKKQHFNLIKKNSTTISTKIGRQLTDS